MRKLLISGGEYELFCKKHKGQKCFVPESNKVTAKSYLILDEYLRFLDRDGRPPTRAGEMGQCRPYGQNPA